jgi:hypothetical protein
VDLKAIREVVPGWPSELDTAKQPTEWVRRARTFMNAAVVLHDEQAEAYSQVFQQAAIQTAERELRLDIQMPAVFCLCFAVELAVKAALVRQGALNELTSGELMPLANHKLGALAGDVAGLNLTEGEAATLGTAGEIVLRHKYPVGPKPSDSESGVPTTFMFESFLRVLEPLFERLLVLATVAEDD